MSNLTLEECIKYGNEEQLRNKLIEVVDGKCGEIKKLNQAEMRIELLEEQLFFAVELINVIEESLDKASRLTEFKKQFRILLDDSYFER